MFSITQNLATETEILTYVQNSHLIGISENLYALDTLRDFLSVNFRLLKHASVLFGKNNLYNYDNLVFYFTKNLLETSLPNNFFTEFIKDPSNIENIFSFLNTYSKQNIFYDHFLNARFCPVFSEKMDWKASSNNLTERPIINCLSEKRYARTTDTNEPSILTERPIINCLSEKSYARTADTNEPSILTERPIINCLSKKGNARKTNTNEPSILLNEIYNCASKTDFKPLTAHDLGCFTADNSENQKLNLVCVFTNRADNEETSSNFNKIHHGEDIRLILPMTWNIVVAHNVLTLSDENNQHITIFFRNPLKAKFDYKLSNLPSDRKFRFNSSVDKTDILNDRIHSSRMRRFFSPSKTTTKMNHDFEPFTRWNSPLEYKLSKQVAKKEIKSDCFLLLKDPILLNYIDKNKIKQMLMYKDHSLENVPKDRSKINSCKILGNLIDKSVEYNSEPVHVVFEPLKLMKRLKKEKMKSLNVTLYSKCKHDIIENHIYKKLLQYKNIINVSDTHYEEKARIKVLENDSTIQVNNKSGMPNQLLISTHSCLDLPKNFMNAATNQNCDMNEYTTEVHDKSVITTVSCMELPKNFSKSVTKKENDMAGQFSSKQSNTNLFRQGNRTALKQVNVKQIVSSVFRHFFHFYSMYGGNLRSGAVISRSNSNYWLKISGVATDSDTLRLAGDLFNTVAGKRIVLNIFDYIKFLALFARNRRLIITKVVKQMMAFEQLSEPVFSKEKCKKCRKMKNPENEPTEFCYDTHLPISQSLPNMWKNSNITPSNADVGTRNCFSQEIF